MIGTVPCRDCGKMLDQNNRCGYCQRCRATHKCTLCNEVAEEVTRCTGKRTLCHACRNVLTHVNHNRRPESYPDIEERIIALGRLAEAGLPLKWEGAST